LSLVIPQKSTIKLFIFGESKMNIQSVLNNFYQESYDEDLLQERAINFIKNEIRPDAILFRGIWAFLRNTATKNNYVVKNWKQYPSLVEFEATLEKVGFCDLCKSSVKSNFHSVRLIESNAPVTLCNKHYWESLEEVKEDVTDFFDKYNKS